jgi:VanZ family protein
MPPLASLRRSVLIGLALICAVLLFLGGPDLVDTRSFKRAWDLGHIVAFATWSLLLVEHPRLKGKAWAGQLIRMLVFTLAVGGGVEAVQGLFGRYPGWADLGRDFIGSLLAMSFLTPARRDLPRGRRRIVQAAVLGLLLVALMPLARALADEWDAWRAFPVLADFEAPFELDRWSGDAALSIDHHIVANGRRALRIDLNTDQYSGVALHYGLGDWRGWDWITFSIFNPDAEPIRLVCKINDHLHDVSGYRYSDRFNRSIDVGSGWQRVRIALDDVRQSPRKREMDLGRITEFNLFAVSLPHPRTIYLDRLTLEH